MPNIYHGYKHHLKSPAALQSQPIRKIGNDQGKMIDGLRNISGWFHFKGEVLAGKDCRNNFESGGYTFALSVSNDILPIGFSEGNDLTFYEENTGLVQVEFNTRIPWVITRFLEDIYRI